MTSDFFDEGFVAEGQLGVVDAAFFFAEFGIENGINFVWQLGEHVVFHAAQDERRNLALELVQAGGVLVAGDRNLVKVAEFTPAVEIAW